MSQPGDVDPRARQPLSPQPPRQPTATPHEWPTGQSTEQRRDAEAALDSYLEMGPQWQREVVDSFMTRVDATRNEQWQQSEYVRQQKLLQERAAQRARTRELVLALVFAIPLTGIASQAGLLGMVVCWAGIAAVVLAVHGSGPRSRPSRGAGR